MSITNIPASSEQAMKNKSVINLPDNPSAAGLKAADIKNALTKPMFDSTDSLLSFIKTLIYDTSSSFDLCITGASISGRTITFTRPDGSSETITVPDSSAAAAVNAHNESGSAHGDIRAKMTDIESTFNLPVISYNSTTSVLTVEFESDDGIVYTAGTIDLSGLIKHSALSPESREESGQHPQSAIVGLTAALSAINAAIAAKVAQSDYNADKQTLATKAELSAVETIARGAQSGTVYASYTALISALNTADNSFLLLGQSIYIKTLSVPDVWISKKEESSVPYTYTTDRAFENAMKSSDNPEGVQVGYYRISALESAKVDLSGYVGIGSQSFTDAQKTQARDNIGALGGGDIKGVDVVDEGETPLESASLWIDEDGDYSECENIESQSLGISGALTGQLARIKTTDENGVPTEWEAMNAPIIPEKKFELIKHIQLTQDAQAIRVTQDEDGNNFELSEAIYIIVAAGSSGATESANLIIKAGNSVSRSTSNTVYTKIGGILASGGRNSGHITAVSVDTDDWLDDSKRMIFYGYDSTGISSVSAIYSGTKTAYTNHITSVELSSSSSITKFGNGTILEIWGIRK